MMMGPSYFIAPGGAQTFRGERSRHLKVGCASPDPRFPPSATCRLRSSVPIAGPCLSSIGPILQPESRDLSKMAEVTSGEDRSMRQCNAGDQQVGPTDLFQLLDLSESVELGGACGVEWNND